MRLQPEELQVLRSAARVDNLANALALCAVYLPHLKLEEAHDLINHLKGERPDL